MFTVNARLILFASSIAPLLLVFSLLDTWGRGIPSLVCVGLAGLSTLGLAVSLRMASHVASTRLRAANSKRRDGDAIAYVVTYFVPFLTVPADTPRRAVALGILFTLIAAFYIRGELYYWNPILALVGYRVIEIETPNRDVVSLITKRRRVRQGVELSAIALADNVYWEKNRA